MTTGILDLRQMDSGHSGEAEEDEAGPELEVRMHLQGM
jgi:hypothetical protein